MFWGGRGGALFGGERESALGDIPLLEILDSCYPFLRIADHLTEEVGEAGAAELGRPRAVEVPVIDGFAVGGGAEAVCGGGGADEGRGGRSGGERGFGARGCVHCIMNLTLVELGHGRGCGCSDARAAAKLHAKLLLTKPFYRTLGIHRTLD